MEFVKVDDVKEEKFEIVNKEPLTVVGRDVCAVHNDTDSVYFSLVELKHRLIKAGIKIETEEEYRDFYKKCEDLFQRFFDRILQIRAQKTKTTNKIKFNRENIFKNMFCFARKLYIGNTTASNPIERICAIRSANLLSTDTIIYKDKKIPTISQLR